MSALPFAKGDTVTTSDQIVIIGKGSVEVQLNVPEAAFRTLAVGERAELVTPGGGRAAGIVTRLGLLPDDSNSGSTTFPVLVAATGSDATTLPAGAAAAVTVTLGVSRNVIVLPVSAVARTGSTGTVQVLDNGVLTRTDVTLGRVGLATIEITSGLRAGQTVVVADNTVALPTINLRGLRGGGGLGGGSGGPAGGERWSARRRDQQHAAWRALTPWLRSLLAPSTPSDTSRQRWLSEPARPGSRPRSAGPTRTPRHPSRR